MLLVHLLNQPDAMGKTQMTKSGCFPVAAVRAKFNSQGDFAAALWRSRRSLRFEGTANELIGLKHGHRFRVDLSWAPTILLEDSSDPVLLEHGTWVDNFPSIAANGLLAERGKGRSCVFFKEGVAGFGGSRKGKVCLYGNCACLSRLAPFLGNELLSCG